MERCVFFPVRIEDDNRKGFAFTVELARRSNTDIVVLTTLDLGASHLASKEHLETNIKNKKDKIFCSLLEMQGYYHGRFNQWNPFDEINIRVRIVDGDMNGAICSAINENKDIVIVLQQRYFSGTGLYEEVFSSSLHCNSSFYILPRDQDFDEPCPNVIGVLFNKQKRLAFMKMLQVAKKFDLPEDSEGFREEMIIQQAV